MRKAPRGAFSLAPFLVSGLGECQDQHDTQHGTGASGKEKVGHVESPPFRERVRGLSQ